MESSVIIAAALFALALGGVSGAMFALRGRSDPVVRRLRRESDEPLRGAAQLAVVANASSKGLLVADRKLSALERQLVQAGLRAAWAGRAFLVAKGVLAVVLPAAFLTFNALLPEPIKLAMPIAIALGATGLFLPNIWVGSRIAERRLTINRALPDALDLLVTCVEAGLGLDAALLRVADDIALSWPMLSEELKLTFLEIKAGMNRTEAFRRLYDRTGADELKSLAATLAQAEMFGTSIALALRIQASALRTRRMYRAEERAAIVAVKMTVPLVLCILPSLIAIIMGPAAVNIYNSLFNKMGGQ